MKKSAPGYMLVITMMVSAVAIVAITYLVYRARVYQPRVRGAIERDAASLLAMSGIQCAMSLLGGKKESQEVVSAATDPKKAGAASLQKARNLFMALAPINGHWHTISLKEDKDGLTGAIQFCITSEDSKIDLNAIYDFAEKKFLVKKDMDTPAIDYRSIMQDMLKRVGELVGRSDLFKELEEFLKKRDAPLNDVTELLAIKSFDVFQDAVFYVPSQDASRLYLADLFSVDGGGLIDVWTLSPSFERLIGGGRESKNIARDAELVKKMVECFAPGGKLNKVFETGLSAVYGVPFSQLPAYAQSLFSTTFGPRIFSVLSYGIVEKTTYKLLAIVSIGDETSQESNAAYRVTIKKLYRL